MCLSYYFVCNAVRSSQVSLVSLVSLVNLVNIMLCYSRLSWIGPLFNHVALHYITADVRHTIRGSTVAVMSNNVLHHALKSH